MAAVYTTKSAFFTFSKSEPIVTSIPSLISLSVISDLHQSLPVTFIPKYFIVSAIPLMLIPPIPMKCIVLYFFISSIIVDMFSTSKIMNFIYYTINIYIIQVFCAKLNE